jgi:hypothetical protein
MGLIDYNEDTEVSSEESSREMEAALKEFGADSASIEQRQQEPQGEEEYPAGSVQSVIDKNKIMREAKSGYRRERIQSILKPISNFLKNRPGSSRGVMTMKSINPNPKQTTTRLPQKFKYYRDKKTGKIYKRTINPAFALATKSSYDKAGRVRSNKNIRFGSGMQKAFLNPKSKFELQTRILMQQQPQNKYNKFNKVLEAERELNDAVIRNRDANTQPAGWVQQRLQQRRLAIEQAHEHARVNSLLHAHDHNLTASENRCIDLFDSSILNTQGNNIMENRPDSINILQTGRPSLLSADSGNNLFSSENQKRFNLKF